MGSVQEPLKSILELYCHVQTFGVRELRDNINEGRMRFDVKLLERQMDDLLTSSEFPVEEVNSLTSNEFESVDEAVQWFTKIRNVVFRGEPWP